MKARGGAKMVGSVDKRKQMIQSRKQSRERERKKQRRDRG